MRLSRIEISGFRGVRDTISLRLPSGFTVISGRNGSGKSTFCDAIEYVLTGDIRRESGYSENAEGYQDYIAWRGDGKPEGGTYVALYLRDDDGQEFVVTRRPDEELEVRPNIGGDGERKAALDDPKNALISKLCLANQAPDNPLRRLCETSVIRDERITDLSVEAGERERYKFVRRALGTSVFSDSIIRAENLRDQLRERVEELERECRDYQKGIDRLKSALESRRETAEDIKSVEASVDFVKQKLEEADLLDDVDVNTTQLIERSRRYMVSLREEADELARVLSDYGDLRERVARYQEGGEAANELERIEADLNAVQENIADVQAQKEKLEREFNDFRAEQPKTTDLAELHRLGQEIGLTESGECPLCGESHTAEEFEARLQRIRDRVDEVAARSDEFRSAIDRLEDRSAKFQQQKSKLEEERAVLQDKEESIISRLKSLRSRANDILQPSEDTIREQSSAQDESERVAADSLPDLPASELEREINERRRLRTQLDEKTSDVEASLALEEIEGLNSDLEAAQRNFDEAKERLRQTGKRAEEADKVRRRVKEEEAQVHKDRIRRLTPLLAELYSRLRPHVDWRNIEPKIRGEIQLYLRFDVGGQNPSLFFSSGQRRAVGLAFLMAVHLGCTWSRLRTLVLDDPVQHIDDFRALQLTEVLSAIRRSGRQMIITVEDEALARLLRRRLRSSEAERGQHIQMAYDSRSGARVANQTIIEPMPERVLAGLE